MTVTGELENKLVAAFKFFDLNGDGTINWNDLTEIVKQLDPDSWTDEKVNAVLKAVDKGETGCIDYSNFATWITSDTMEGKRVMTIYEAAVAKMPGQRLADGDTTNAGVEKIRSYLNNALDLKPEEYALPKAATKLTWLREVAELLDPMRNPGGFRLCQSGVVERGAISPLLRMAREAQCDGVVTKSLEVLARTTFGNKYTAAAVASNEHFLPTINALLSYGKQPEKLSMLQLAQAIAASSMTPEVQDILPKLVAVVVPLLADTSFFWQCSRNSLLRLLPSARQRRTLLTQIARSLPSG